jgi:galactonate dehydratase
MKIIEIKPYLMQVGARPAADPDANGLPVNEGDLAGSRNWLFVKVVTDEGIYGVGECSGWPKVIETAVKDLAHVLVGEDPANIDRL